MFSNRLALKFQITYSKTRKFEMRGWGKKRILHFLFYIAVEVEGVKGYDILLELNMQITTR